MQDTLYYNIKKASNTLSSMVKNKMDFMSVNVAFIVDLVCIICTLGYN